jgi:hypothetical protein
MVTRFYLHSTTDSTTGLPTTEQSASASSLDWEAQTNNRVMNTTIGVAQTLVTKTSASAFTNARCFVSKWVSPPLDQTSVAANTWKWNFACKDANFNPNNYPCLSTSTVVPITCYVWRPGTASKVGNILDGDSATGFYDNGGQGVNTEKSNDGTFTGSAVASVQQGDVIIMEAWVYINTAGGSEVYSFYYDGTTVTTTDGTTVSNHASFLETPENLTFFVAGAITDETLYRALGVNVAAKYQNLDVANADQGFASLSNFRGGFG